MMGNSIPVSSNVACLSQVECKAATVVSSPKVDTAQELTEENSKVASLPACKKLTPTALRTQRKYPLCS